MFLTDLLERQKHNKKDAIRQGECVITYGDWNTRSCHLSKIINAVILNNSLNVSLFLPNSIEYAVAYFAVLFSKRIVVPIGVQSKSLEIISTLEYCEIDLIISNLEYRNVLKEFLASYNYKIVLLFVENQKSEILNAEKEFASKSNAVTNTGNDDDVAIMLHTSGTTSNPKRVMLTHRNLVNNIESNIVSLQLTELDKTLIAMPMHFGYCNTAQFLTHLYLGASIVILNNLFLPKQFFRVVEKEKITNFTGVPSMLLMLLDYQYIDNYDFKSLKYICFGGGKMPIDKLKQLIHKYSTIGFVQTYGQTECSPRITALLPEQALLKIGSVGKNIQGVSIRIVDDRGNALSHDKIGEIIVSGKNTMKGYYKQSEMTLQVIRNGWVHTGDLGYIDDEGYLYLTGRIKNIIISGGINIYPEEIEQVLTQHEAVIDAWVIGEEHNLLGEVPIAKVVLRYSIKSSELTHYCAERLADYKIPVKFDVVNELLKTYNGKIKRF